MTDEDAQKLAEEHWEWIESVLADRQTETKHMFIEGFKHGFKHGRANNNEESNRIKP